MSLTYRGALADKHQLDFYDASHALIGFQRSLALTTHLVLNGEIITQAPSLKGATINLSTPEEGSWTVVTVISLLAAGAYKIGTTPRDTVIGHLVASAYDYMVSELLGFNVDFDKTLGKQYDEMQAGKRKKVPVPKPTQSKMDALIEKCELSVKDMHRPMYASGSAEKADLEYRIKRATGELQELTPETYDYINTSVLEEVPVSAVGSVTSYNINTFRGRIYSLEEKRPVPFDLHESVRDFTQYL